MSRAAYEKHVLLAGLETADDATRDRALRSEYPKSTLDVAQELKARGVGITPNAWNSLVVRNRVHRPPGDPDCRSLRWLPEDVDAAIQNLADLDYLTPTAWACLVDGVSFDQQLEAEWDFRRRHPDLSIGEALKVVVPENLDSPRRVSPSVPNRVVYAKDVNELAKLLG
jgi:hypothetical protein